METITSKGTARGILKSFRARHAEEAIEHSEGLVSMLRLTQADLKPAEDALRVAKELFAAHHFSKALNAARRAEAIAITLDERYSGFQKAVKSLQDTIDRLEKLGLPTEDLHGVVGRGEEKVGSGIWENGSFIPNYLEGRVLIEHADNEGRERLSKAESASNQIFLAELAMEALVDVQGPADPKAFGEGVALGLEQALEQATRELALGNADGAARIAKDLEERAMQLRKDYIDATRTATATEARLADLRGEGIATDRIESQLEIANDMLAKGLIDPGASMIRRLSKEAEALGQTYGNAVTGLADAEVLYAQLQKEGFHSYEADAAIRDARRSIREGNYARAMEHLEKAHAAFVRRRNVREALAKAIEETRTRVVVLKDSGLPFIQDVQELLRRAEREFQDGNYSGSSEDLRIATLLLGPPGRSGGTS